MMWAKSVESEQHRHTSQEQVALRRERLFFKLSYGARTIV